jgi:hypothetical protein
MLFPREPVPQADLGTAVGRAAVRCRFSQIQKPKTFKDLGGIRRPFGQRDLTGDESIPSFPSLGYAFALSLRSAVGSQVISSYGCI